MNFELSNTDPNKKTPTRIDGAGKVPSADKSPLRKEADNKNSAETFTTIIELSTSEVRIEIKDASFPYWKRKSNRHHASCDKMQTDKQHVAYWNI